MIGHAHAGGRTGGRVVVGLLTAAVLGTAAVALISASDPVAPAPPDLIGTVPSELRPSVYLDAPPLDEQRQFRLQAPEPSLRIAPGDGARLILRRLDIDLPLREGDAARDIARQATPSGAAFHLPGTALPGEIGNAYVYAHARAGQFLGLWEVRLGDRVEIVAPAGQALAYVVVEIHPRVAVADLTYTQPTEGERLTLQTSTGPQPTDPRFVVVAAPVRP